MMQESIVRFSLCLLLIALSMSGCASDQARIPAQSQEQVVADRKGQLAAIQGCLDALKKDPQLAAISSKVALGKVTEQTAAMLADTSRASDTEKQPILLWHRKRDVCLAGHVPYWARWQMPPPLVHLYQAQQAAAQALIDDLFLGFLTYGEYAAKRQAIFAEEQRAEKEILGIRRDSVSEARADSEKVALKAQTEMFLIRIK